MLQQLKNESEKVGLTMNLSKTKTMSNGNKEKIYVDYQEIENVDEYIYLGQIIAPKQQMSKEINRRISNSWSRYWSLKEIMKSSSVPISEKRKTFNMCILPGLTYGCQTCRGKKRQTKKNK